MEDRSTPDLRKSYLEQPAIRVDAACPARPLRRDHESVHARTER